MIYCFSGTGNTRYVARLLAKSLGVSVCEFTADELKNPASCVIEHRGKVLIWAFPTYSWGVPPVVRNVIAKAAIECCSDTIHVALTTCGDDVGDLANMFRKCIEARGLNAGAVFSVQMPNTYVMMKGFDVDAPELSKAKVDNASKRVADIAEKIKSLMVHSQNSLIVKGGFPWVKTAVVYPWFVRYRMSSAGFKVDINKCIHCGKCRASCPMNNIEYDSAKLSVWGNDCAFCTACYHVCPTHSVSWRKTTGKKGQKEILE